ncbi:uncharacterized protein [Macrobrachium rosenbergii]|uniref:uncharacterized protein n=1 Tax=Macrobrachium rosenbergii TaxID=79674 RepID=UPI0034D401D1
MPTPTKHREHVRKVKDKVATRNNLLSKLANSDWGTNPQTLRLTALALNYSIAEYCSPVWERSCHSHEVDAEFNQACRIITGALRPTPLLVLYRLAGIAPPNIRQTAHSKTQKYKQENDERHPLYDHQVVRQRLKSRKSFISTTNLDPRESATYHPERSRETAHCPLGEAIQSPCESLPHGTNLCRKDWVTLNRARARVGRTGDNLHKWGLAPSAECLCGHPIQAMDHRLSGCEHGPFCTDLDLYECNQAAVDTMLAR